MEYEAQHQIFKERNSYSKTDPDATFMRMKDGPMRNGQTKPGYNLQVATSHQFFLAFDLFPNPIDTRTLIPFMEIHRVLFEASAYIGLDSGYGSQANYPYLEENFPDLTPLIPYDTYYKEKSKKWQEDPKKVMNWDYNEENYSIDLEGVRFNFHTYRKMINKYGYERSFKEYHAEKFDADQNIIEAALTDKGNVHKIRINPELEYYKAKQRELLSDEENKKFTAIGK
nr:transposase [Suicoccus acidiformans]